MFDHILVPTDGSKLAGKAVRAAVKFAATINARITFYQALENSMVMYGADGFAVPADTLDSIDKAMRKSAQVNLDEIGRAHV